MLNNIKFGNRGDTLVEVLFAVSIFSLVAVGALSIMNQGTATAQRSLEITLVRQQIDAQAETLRFLNASYISNSSTFSDEWEKIQEESKKNTEASDYNATSCKVPLNSFILNTHTAKFEPPIGNTSPKVPATTFSQVRYDYDKDTETYSVSSAEGIWIEAVASPDGTGNEADTGYIDFYIRACWDSPGQAFPVTIGTIVRLYEPRQ